MEKIPEPSSALARLQRAFWAQLRDPQTEDISISSENGLIYHRHGHWHRGESADLATLEQFTRELAHLIAETAGVTLGPRHPSLDAQLGSFGGVTSFRAHVVMPPLSGSGTLITLRRLDMESPPPSLEDFGFLPSELEDLQRAVRERDSILVCGATGSGKTSLLRSLLQLVPTNERVAILEDSAELRAPNAMSFCLRSRQNRFESVEGTTWTLEQLVYESLRMRPDRIVLGECRGPEARGLLHALQSGHRGVMCTMHASTMAQALERYRNLVHLATNDSIAMASAAWDWVVLISLEGATARRRTRVFRVST